MAEYFAEVEFNRPRQSHDYAGNLTQGAVEEISEWMETWKNEPATA